MLKILNTLKRKTSYKTCRQSLRDLKTDKNTCSIIYRELANLYLRSVIRFLVFCIVPIMSSMDTQEVRNAQYALPFRNDDCTWKMTKHFN